MNLKDMLAFVAKQTGGEFTITPLPDPVTMKSIEYYPNGNVKLIVYRDTIDIEPETYDRLKENAGLTMIMPEANRAHLR